jgi:PAS domain S-box-containing protein
MLVLVVEDSKITALPLLAYLKKQGHTVTHVENGRAAVDAFRQNPPDLVLMDIIMPEMDGIEATRRIKAGGGARWVPVIIMTSLSAKNEIIEGFDAGADDYLVKPIDFDLLGARMRSMQRVVTLQDSLFSILDNVYDAILSIDEAGMVQSYNKAAEHIFGYSPAEIIGNNINMLMPSPYTEEHDGYIARYLHERTPHMIGIGRKVPGRRKNGEVFPLVLSVREIRNNNGSQFIGVIRDISEEEKAHKKAMNSAHLIAKRGRFIQTITDAIPSLISHWDKDLCCSFANKSYLEWFGKSAQDILGASMQEVLGESLFATNEAHIRGALAGERQQFEQTLTKADGSFGHTLTYYIPDFDLDGTVAGFYVLVTDVTTLKEVERLKAEFISIVSHELRTPLTSILGSLALLSGGVAGKLPETARPLVDIAHKNSQRLILLVNDILDMEKIEAGKMVFDLQPVELMPLLKQSLDANRAYAETHEASFELSSGLPDVKVLADANRLLQVFANLLSNAAKFSPPGEKVIVAMECIGAQIRTSVTDHGSGIPEQFKHRIFQKFAQAESSDTRSKGGTGLGLSITKAIVEKMGGTIGFDSQPNVRTTFFVDFPEWHEGSPAESTRQADINH